MNRKRLVTFGTLALSLFSVFVGAIATLSWFQIDSQPLQTGMVSGSSDIDIQKVTGYKINQELNSKGFVNYDNNTITNMDAVTEDWETTINTDKETADINFDVPNGGIGYYLVKPSATGSFTFTTATYYKFTEYSSGNLCYINKVYFSSVGALFRVRSYQMDGSKTALTNVTVNSVTYNGATNAYYLSNGDVVVPAVGTYKVWYNSSSRDIGLEFLSASDTTGRSFGIKRLHGSDRIYCSVVDFTGWLGSSAKIACVVSSSNSGGKCYTMKQAATNYYYVDNIDTSSYLYVDFCRMNSTFNTADGTTISSANFWNYKWNDTGYQTIPTDIYGGNNCFYVKGWDNSGDWGTYSSRTYNVTISVNGGSYTAMRLESGTSYYYNIPSATTGHTLAYKINGEAISVSKGTGSSGFNQNNTSNGSQISYGNSRSVTVYLDISARTVWVSTVYELCIAGSTKYEMSQVVSGDGDYNSSFRQYKATYSGTAGQAVTVLVNGTSTAYNRDSDTYNNLNNSKNLAKDATNESAYLKFGDSDASPTWDQSHSYLYLAGNKTYHIYPDASVTGTKYEMTYENSGTYAGWYKKTGLSVTGAKSLRIDLNGVDKTSEASYYTGGTYNSVLSTKKWADTGVVDVYYDTSTKKIYATPIYKITIGGTTLQAFPAETNIYRTSGNFTMTDGQAISAKRNGSSYSVTRMADNSLSDRNNITTAGTKYVMYDATDTAEINVSTNQIWVSGYAPVYYYSTNAGSTWNAMTYNAATSTSEVTATITARLAKDTSIIFKKSASNTSFNAGVNIDSNAFNNLKGSAGNLQVVSALTANTTLKLNFDAKTAYLGGRTLTYYWYNANHSLADNAQFKYYLFNGSSGSSLSSWPGTNLSVDGSDSRLQYFSFNADTGYDSVIFDDGYSSTASDAHQTVDIDLKSVTDGYVCRVSQSDNGFSGTTISGVKKWTVEWKDEPPSNDEDYTFYVNDSNNYFSGSVYGMAWDSVGTYMDKGGAFFPGVAMTVIMSGKLYKFTVADEYDSMLFANSTGTRQTNDFNNIGSLENGGVWIATGYSSKVTGSWGTLKNTSVGSATIYKSSNQGSTWTEMATMNDGDLSTNDFMFERGIQATDGDYLKVEVDYTSKSDATYSNSSNFIVDDVDRPYLQVTASKIEVTLDSDTAKARFNFYITTSGKLAIVMVPDLGNGFYIIPYSTTTEGFVGAMKMNSSSTSSATYSGFMAEAGDSFFIRSYLNAVDTLYTSNGGMCEGVSMNGSGVITFSKSGHYDIEVNDGSVSITSFDINDFFKLNPLDMNNIANQNAIKGQKTTLVLEVVFTTASNNFQMSTSLAVNNSISDYTGVSFLVRDDDHVLSDPYTYMRTNKYTLSTDSILTDDVFRTALNDGEMLYHAYILIDYRYSASLSSMPVKPIGNIQFKLRTTQV